MNFSVNFLQVCFVKSAFVNYFDSNLNIKVNFFKINKNVGLIDNLMFFVFLLINLNDSYSTVTSSTLINTKQHRDKLFCYNIFVKRNKKCGAYSWLGYLVSGQFYNSKIAFPYRFLHIIKPNTNWLCFEVIMVCSIHILVNIDS